VVTSLIANAIECPHRPTARGSFVQVYGKGGRAMNLCRRCKTSLANLAENWERGFVSPRQVIAMVRALGYTRLDAARFLFDLVKPWRVRFVRPA
jgi:hypothetical protein